MSDYGLHVNRLGNKIQIDGERSNYAIYQNGTFHCTAGQAERLITIDAGLADPCFCALNFATMDTTNDAIAPFCTEWDSVNGDWATVHVGVDGAFSAAKYFIASWPQSVNREKYGMEVFSSNGTPVFNTWDIYPQLVDIHTTTIVGFSSLPSDITVTNTDDNYFVLLPLNWHWKRNATDTLTHYSTVLMQKRNSTTIRLLEAVVGSCAAGATGIDADNWNSAISIIELAPPATM